MLNLYVLAAFLQIGTAIIVVGKRELADARKLIKMCSCELRSQKHTRATSTKTETTSGPLGQEGNQRHLIRDSSRGKGVHFHGHKVHLRTFKQLAPTEARNLLAQSWVPPCCDAFNSWCLFDAADASFTTHEMTRC